MNDENLKSRIQQAVDQHAARLRPDPFLAQRILSEERKEGIMIRKFSAGLMVALLLLLATVTALAVSNWDILAQYFEKTRSMASSGELDRFSEEDQLKLLAAMAEAGLINKDDPRLLLAQDETKPLEERAQAAGEIIAERYGADYFSFRDIENIELHQDGVTTEDQAAYSAWAKENEAKQKKQTPEPITETRTYRDVAGLLTEIGLFPRELIRDVQVTSEYSETDQRWTVIASIDQEEYVQALRRQAADEGNVFSYYGYVEGDTWNIRFYLDEYGEYLGLYDASDPEQRSTLSLGDAYPLALMAAQARLHVNRAELEKLSLRQLYCDSGMYDLKNGNFRAACNFSWYDGDEPLYTVEIDAENGQVLEAFNWPESLAMQEKERAWVSELKQRLQDAGADPSLLNKEKRFFWYWSLEEKAAWSQIAHPIAQQYYAEQPDFAQYLKDVDAGKYIQNEWPILCTVTQFLYGVPDENAISQQRAFEIAREYALSQGVRQSDIDENKGHQYYYDITDPQRPLWKVDIFLIFGDGDLAHQQDGTEPWGVFVVIDAHTGEILRTIMRDVNTEIWELV